MGRKQEGGFGDVKIYGYKLAGMKKGMDVHFKVTTKEDGQYVDLDTETYIEGALVEVKTRSYEYEGDTVRLGQLYLKDALEGELYIVEFGINSVGRSIINALAGSENPIDRVSISVYMKDGFPNGYVQINGEKTNWKYDWETQMKKVEVIKKKGKKEEKDYFDLNQFMLDEVLLKEVQSLLVSRGASHAGAAPVEDTADNPAETGDETVDDLPF